MRKENGGEKRNEKGGMDEAKMVLSFKRSALCLRTDRSDDIAGGEGVYSEILGEWEQSTLWY